MWLWFLLSCALAVPFIWFMCPETTGKSLEEIDLLFAERDRLDDTARDELKDKAELEWSHREDANA